MIPCSKQYAFAQLLFPRLEWFQKGFRWLHASGTTIGSYSNGNDTLAALRPVSPGGSNVFERVGHNVLPAGTGPTESSKQTAFQGSRQLLPPPGQARRKAIHVS